MLVTFDCYGTLIDWESGIRQALLSAYPESRAMDYEELGDAFHVIQNRLKTSEYRSYRSLLAETADELARVHGWSASDERAAAVPASLPDWPAFSDTNPALERLRDAGARLGILSNIDDDLLARSLERLTVDFDHLGTAESLRSYKPGAAHFDLGGSWAGSSPWTHVAQSLFHDIVPATALGIETVWVNRRAETTPPDARPVHVSPDLASAADWLLARG